MLVQEEVCTMFSLQNILFSNLHNIFNLLFPASKYRKVASYSECGNVVLGGLGERVGKL